jgi:hypothetical protein
MKLQWLGPQWARIPTPEVRLNLPQLGVPHSHYESFLQGGEPVGTTKGPTTLPCSGRSSRYAMSYSVGLISPYMRWNV